jgi:hypothetical protein
MNAIFPRHAGNTYAGRTLALWLLGFVVLIRAFMGSSSAFNAAAIVTGAHGIPLASYPTAAAQTIVALFTGLGVDLMFWCALAIVILIRYRALVPMMFLFFMLAFIARRVQSLYVPVPTTGTPPAPHVTMALFVVMVIGFVLSLWPRRAAKEIR